MFQSKIHCLKPEHSILGIDNNAGESYEKINNKLTRWTKTLSKIWSVAIILMASRPFVMALFDYLMERYSFASWTLLYESSL